MTALLLLHPIPSSCLPISQQPHSPYRRSRWPHPHSHSHTHSQLLVPLPIRSHTSTTNATRSRTSSSSVTSASLAQEESESREEEPSSPPPSSDSRTSVADEQLPTPIQNLPLRGCKTCGREELERGCNGEGRIQGGIATFPGFGWWPIKAYRPCPAFVASGGRYRRFGQSMDEVAWGRVEKEASIASTAEVQSSKKNQSTKTSR